MMSFEDTLRRRLHEQAGAIPLPPRLPEGAARRAHARRNHRRVAAAAAAAVVLAGAAAVAIPGLGSDGTDPVSMAGPGLAGLPAVGPIELDWQATDGGVTPYASRTFQGTDGTVYALSSAPGPAEDGAAATRALYRLADDGTWAPVALDDGLLLADAAAVGDLLYGVSTAPAAGGGTAVLLSSSSDGGETWSPQDVPAVPPPSDDHPWRIERTAQVESRGDTTLALVTTAFSANYDEVFPELATDGAYVVEERPEGVALMLHAEGDRQASGEPATPPAAPPTQAAEPSTTVPDAERSAEVLREGGSVGADGTVTDQPAEDVRIVPWAELGIDGPDQLRGVTQAFRTSGDGWQGVEGDLTALAGLGGLDLQADGDQFIASGYDRDGGSWVFRSADGATWAQVAGPENGSVVSAGAALVSLPMGPQGSLLGDLQASGDGGATWEAVDLTDTGLDGADTILAFDGGPLGLALVLGGEDGVARHLAVTADLASWTVTPIAELDGGMVAGGGVVQPYVGADRVVLKVAESDLAGEGPPASRTVVGTPRR